MLGQRGPKGAIAGCQVRMVVICRVEDCLGREARLSRSEATFSPPLLQVIRNAGEEVVTKCPFPRRIASAFRRLRRCGRRPPPVLVPVSPVPGIA